MHAAVFGTLLLMVVACGDESGPALPAVADRFDCGAFVPPPRDDDATCADVDASRPTQLVRCRRGSGHLGHWTIDAAGLPAYDFTVEQRCDPVAHAYSPRSIPLRDPIHLIGNGRGLVAMAHASGGVEIYSQDRGHKWINRIDTWSDPQHPDYPPQLGGGFNYYAVLGPAAGVGSAGRRAARTPEASTLRRAPALRRPPPSAGLRRTGPADVPEDGSGGRVGSLRPTNSGTPLDRTTSATVGSTRFEDLPVNRATQMQTRRFGTGYVETVTQDREITLRRRVFAPDAEARALVAEVTVENPTVRPQRYAIVELWDVNISQLSLELLTSDVGFPGVTQDIDRRRRAVAAQFTQHAEWNADQRLAVVRTVAKAPPSSVRDRLDVSRLDYFPDPIYLAVLDDGPAPDAVWLSDTELWDGAARTPPAAIAQPGNAGSRGLDLDGEGQHALLAVRVPVTVPPGGAVTRRFAFGYAPGGGPPEAAVAALRAHAETLMPEAEASWRARLVWAAFPGLPNAGVVQRELAWAAYNALANTTFDEYRHVRLLGQGGAYKYIHGIDGAMGDLALFAEALTLIDPGIARDTLTYALATQQGASQTTPWRFPYATTGVGAFSDVLIYDQRSDAYYFLPAAIGRYVALTRDAAFLDQPVRFWPRAGGEEASVTEHVRRALQYGTETLGFGARGLVAIGTGDYADGINSLATEPATPTGSSSTYNAGAIIYGFGLAADVIAARDPGLAAVLRGLATSQAQALLERAWEGHYFYRGFVDSGNPLAPQIFFLEPQVFPVLAGIVDDTRRDLALGEVVTRLETDIGALSNVTIGADSGVGGPDRPLVGGIWPVANAWLTGAYARRDPNQAWSSFTRNTLAAHAEKYPDLWYGIWTGPDSFNGPDNERPGEADAHLVTALTDYPALNAHLHTSPLRALMEIVGVNGTRDGVRITPHLPSETFAVEWPQLHLRSTPDTIAGEVVASSDGPMVMEVALPSGLRSADAVRVTADEAAIASSVAAGIVRFVLPVRTGIRLPWRVERN